MKQINKRYLCYWCMGCTGQGEIDYKPKQRCNGFMPDRPDWQEKWKEALKNANRNTI